MSDSEAIRIEEIRLEADYDESHQDLLNIRDQMILNEMELHHKDEFDQIRSLLNVFISDQVETFQKDKEEYLYFLSPDDPQVYSLEEQLVETHSKKLKESLTNEHQEIPEFLLGYAVELFEENIRDFMNINKKALTTTKDVQDFVDEWTEFVKTILVNIYEQKTKFWDEDILDKDSTLTVQFIELFLFCQETANQVELKELKI
jgi:hypothetical protein